VVDAQKAPAGKDHQGWRQAMHLRLKDVLKAMNSRRLPPRFILGPRLPFKECLSDQ
jgi:hypothetical protein